uniref:zinc finger protein 449-like n=1 Tax=Jaculus jaculus TaxID=51337 RepID=UPI001E1B4011|nr:zinc finger protein 449-like [Jaculus jaculus]
MARTSSHATRTSSLFSQLPLWQDYGVQCEAARQRFRQFQYSEAARPQEAFLKLWEFCSQWLKPKMHSAEEIVELLVLEQFLRILPSDLGTTVRMYAPRDRKTLFSLIEDLQRDCGRPEWQANIDGKPKDKRGPEHQLSMLPHTLSHSSALHVMEPGTNLLGIPEVEPQELKNYDDGQHHASLGLVPQAQLKHGDIFTKLCTIDTTVEIKKMEISENSPCTSFHRWYEQLESPGKETPEQFLDDCLEPMTYERHSPGDIAGSSHQEQPLGPQPHKQKSPTEQAHCFDQCGQLLTHQKFHTGEPIPGGPRWGIESFQGADLYEHQYFDKSQRPCECSLCTKSYSHVTQLSVSQGKYPDKEMYHCSQCRRKFVYRSSLQAHLKTHTQVKSHECPICGKSFKRPSTLATHQKMHTVEKTFACEYCKKTYKYMSSLLRHLTVHTGEQIPNGRSGRVDTRKEEGLVADQAAASGAEFPMNEFSCTGPAEDTTP